MTSNAAARVVHVCNAAFFGIGAYLYLLEFGIHLSLVPPRFEQSVSAQITVLAEYAAAMGYVALLYWALPFFVAPFFMPNALSRRPTRPFAQAVSSTGPQTPFTFSPKPHWR